MIANEVTRVAVSKSHLVDKELALSLKRDKKKRQRHGPSVRQLRMRVTRDDPLYLGLHKIKISGKELSTLPTSIFELTELQVLDLSPEREACLYYHLAKLPSEIGNLTNLTVLALDTNRLTEVPDALCQLHLLERLGLSNNFLSALPNDFHKLTNLRSFYCSNNRLVDFPQSVCHLQSLVFLDLSDNRIIHVPAELGHLQQLEALILSFNNIVELPSTLCSLERLEILWLSGNKLKYLPKGLSSLKRLDWHYMMTSSAVNDNPLEQPPMSVVWQGPAAIDKYLSLHQSNSLPETVDSQTPRRQRRR